MKGGSLLFRKYVRILFICMGGLTCFVGFIHMAVVAKTQLEAVSRLLDAEAAAASVRIEGFLNNTVLALNWIDDIDEPGVPVDYDAIQDAADRLLRRAPSVASLGFFERNGCQRLFVSRLQPDTISKCTPARDSGATNTIDAALRTSTPSYSDVFFPDGSEPHLYLAIASRGKDTGALLADINLKVIHDTVQAIQIGRSGIGFVVDNSGRLIAHPDETLVLRQTRVFTPPYQLSNSFGIRFGNNFSGQRVVTASHNIAGSTWRLVVEQPIGEALAPVYAALATTGALVLAAIAGSLIAGYIVASRLSRPLSDLRAGAERIGKGDLSTQINVNTGDEIEQVAAEFNRMAIALTDSHAHLEAKVSDRTAELRATTQTVQQQAFELGQLNATLAETLEDARRRKDDAEAANAAKSRFLAAASHDLRQPMHAISLLVGLLSQDIHSPQSISLVRKVQGSVEAMEDLFGSLLDISKLDAGAVRPLIEDFAIEEILERARRSFAVVAEKKAIALDIEGSMAIVRSDPALLERILFNLISNGIRYTPKGHVRVRCIPSNAVLQLRVEDTGIGIPAEHHERIFEEFFQIATPTGNRSGGLGLGLSIVKQCAGLLGHQLSMESDRRGTQFRIDVPWIGSTRFVVQVSDTAREVSDALARAFVVVIDDDVDSRYATEETFRQWGCAVLSADTGPRALAALAEHLRYPDLIITDLQPTGAGNGLDFIKALRSSTELLVPAIVVTGEVTVPGAVRLVEFVTVLQKPVGAERLKEACERLLRQPISSCATRDLPASETKA
jgi:signal transduction histidine kinase/CheY-like chemotaxis protein